MAWTTAEDVTDAWIGDDAPSDTELIDKWIGRAERLIRFNIPGIQARIDADETDLIENVVDVVTAMVTRKFENPRGLRSTNETTGPFTSSQTYGGDTPGALDLLPSELALLTGGAAGGQKAFTIDMIPVTSPFSTNYVPASPFGPFI